MTCKLLANDEKEYPSIFTRYYKSLERIVYKRDRFKKRPMPEVTWIFGPSGVGKIEWIDKYLNSFDIMYKVGNYYLVLTSDKNIVYYSLHPKEKYSDLLQIFTDHHLEVKVNYGYYKFLPEKLTVISGIHSRELCSKWKPHVYNWSEVLKRISRIFECSWDDKTNTPISTDYM
jgi:hypothetical protein